MRCEICGELHSLDEGIIIKGNNHIYFVCDDCNPDNYAICDDCGELVEVDRTYTTHDNRIICEDCYESNGYYTCDRCGLAIEDSDCIYVEDTGEHMCSDCADRYCYQCMDCGRWYSSNKIYTDSSGDALCEDCYCNSYYTCAGCGEFILADDCYWDDRTDEPYCAYCYDEEIRNQFIKSYHSHSNWIVHYTESERDDYMSDKLTLGLEIEVEGNTEFAEGFMERVDSDLIYLEKDNSVEGFEIITQPMTRKYATEVFPNKISEGFKYLRDNDFKGHNAGGIHIHVANYGDTRLTVYRLKRLLYNLDSKQQSLFLKLTQRKKDNLIKWADNQVPFDMSIEYACFQDNRYESLNLDDRTGTLEFRIFNSNLRVERILKNIEMVYALLDYINSSSWNSSSDLYDWMKFVYDNNVIYPNLYLFIEEKQLREKYIRPILKMYSNVA